MRAPGILVCSIFLISECMYIVSIALLIWSSPVIVRAGVEHLYYGVVVCSAVSVEGCVLYPCCVGVFGMFVVMYRRMLFSRVFAITERMDMGLYEVPLSVYLLCFGMETMLVNFYMCGIKSSFQHARKE